ncbi:hypothetical protein ILFOPFJJ_06845 [Ensifer psoraleae]|uniref:DUF1440 domain-containing protein n=1 Tax=Sinorhizobium psoraleae TaxID=520838 RepID=UPI001FEC4307|nr:DUF1440 domain-containing protein [Sinorhizobium psoraleae]NRP75921.1 hypothetical protein [Sinorhizobium psoraleae]
MRIILGAVAGLCATMVMTTAMRRLFAILPPDERYPLPPSEMLESIGGSANGRAHSTRTLSAHFLYGALSGALYPLVGKWLNGPIYGLTVWTASYLGWIPATRILRPATKHPLSRNLLMLAVHLVWGAALAAGFRELELSRSEIFTRGPARDAYAQRIPHSGRGHRMG